MPYQFRGHLCGILCGELEIIEDLSQVAIRVYRPNQQEDLTRRVVADVKDTVTLLSAEQVASKRERLLAECRTDDDGNFTINFGNNQDYNGEAIEIDVYLERAPQQKQGQAQPTPIQVSLTTLQPRWRQSENDFVAVWDYCISQRLWCAIRERLGAWVIIGRLTSCADNNNIALPLAGYTVSAFDRDWLEDDPLGSATTDSNGIFRIDYLEIDFKQTFLSPLVNVETLGASGPDLYFHVRDSSNTLVLEEPSSRGLQPDRDNSPACFCVRLCAPINEEPPYDHPYFTSMGYIQVVSDLTTDGKVNKTVFSNGKVRGRPDYAFFGNVALRGFIPKTHPDSSKPMRYRFLYGVGAVTPTIPLMNNLTQITTVASRLIQWNLPSVGIGWTQQPVVVNPDPSAASPAGVPPVPATPQAVPAHVIAIDTDGWITVDPFAVDDGFNSDLLTFNTVSAVPGGSAPGDGAGNPVSSPRNGQLLSIMMEASATDGTGVMQSPIYPMYVNNWREVGLLALQELAGDPCAEISGNLNIEYTVDHELVANWGVSMSSVAPGWTAPTLPSLSNPPAGATPRGASGTETVSTAGYPTCVYTIRLSGQRMLTDGEELDPSNNLASPIHVYIKN